MFSASAAPSKSLSAASSMMTKLTSGFASADSTVAAESAKPTVTMRSQPWSTRFEMFGA